MAEKVQKPSHPAGTPDPTPDSNPDPTLRPDDPETVAQAAEAAERFDVLGADGRRIVRSMPYQSCVDEAARISAATGEKLEIVEASPLGETVVQPPADTTKT